MGECGKKKLHGPVRSPAGNGPSDPQNQQAQAHQGQAGKHLGDWFRARIRGHRGHGRFGGSGWRGDRQPGGDGLSVGICGVELQERHSERRWVGVVPRNEIGRMDLLVDVAG